MKDKVEAINVKNIENKLKIIAWLESLRWKHAEENKSDIIAYYCNDGLFSFAEDNTSPESAEAILLAHYLVYICDRQMPYEEIFRGGGYTVSILVKKFIEEREKICSSSQDKREAIRNLIKEMIEPEEKDNKNDNSINKYSYYLCNDIGESEKEHIKKYFEYKSMGRRAKFSSRFMITDLLCIYRTLVYLCEKFDGSFSKFLNYAIGKENKKPIVYGETNKIYSLAYSMYRLTYQLIPQVKGNKEDIREILKQEVQGIIGLNKEVKKYLSEPNKNNIKKIEMLDDLWYINDKKAIANEYSFDKKKYESKRLWCVVRDFVYHPLFGKCFKIVTGEKTEDLKKNNAGEFELPGDVWNNNLKFAQCFWFNNKEYDNNVFKNIQKSSKFVRNLYNNENLSNWEKENKEIQCYPKDFDITFNFVPNMCSKDKCDNCPLKSKSGFELDKYCHKQKGKLCTFILYATGLEYICEGSCKLLEFQN